MIWRLSNKFMERELVYSETEGLYTRRWLHHLTGTDFLAQAAGTPQFRTEFAMQVNGQALNSQSPEMQITHSRFEGDTLEIRMAGAGVQVALFYRVYADHPVIRKWLHITNTGTETITLSHLVMEALELSAGATDEQQMAGYYGVMPRELFFTGRMDDPILVQKNALTGEGFIAMNEVPGILKRIDTAWTWQGGFHLMYDTDIFTFERTLAPGETFITAKTGIAFFLDHSPAAPQWIMPQYTSEVLLKKGAAYQPPWIYNTWEHFFRNIDEALLLELIPIAGQIGFDIFTIDDGWQAALGASEVDTANFPNGLSPIKAAIEANGMQLGLWIPLAVVGGETPLYRLEWASRDRHGKPRQTFTMSGLQEVMCLGTPFAPQIAAHIIKIVQQYQPVYLKIDLTTVFNTYGETPGCFAEGHDHRSWAESLTRIYEGIQQVTDLIYQQFPALLIDLTFELWGQKHVIDYGLLAAGDLDWMSNIHDVTPGATRQARMLLYQRALAIPVEAMLIGNLQANIEPIAERFATTIGSAPLLLGDLRQLSEAQIHWYRAKIDWFKALRREIPIQQSFFPLGAWQQPNAGDWDGFARLSQRGEGIIVLFRNQSKTEQVQVHLPLYTRFAYTLRSIMTETSLEATAQQFQTGLALSLTAPVEIYEVRIRVVS